MIFHREQDHKNIKLKLVGKSDDSKSSKKSGCKKEDQPKINESFGTGNTSSQVVALFVAKKERIDNALLGLFVDKMLPLSLVDHSCFKDFLHELDSRYKIPGKKTVSEKISKLYETAQSLLHQDLSRVPNVALTHDTWTSIHTQSYNTVTGHYISPEWELRSAVLQTSLLPGSHTGRDIF